jgi:ligand-binding sensor domain-containing protein/signal transduction histidine kinase
MLASCFTLHAARLPIRQYSMADGLTNNAVLSIATDARGFLWFATLEGLSRFDGIGFTSLNLGTGVPRSTIRRLLIGRHGNYWLATPKGLIRFRPDLPPSSPDRVLVILPKARPEAAGILTLLEDRDGKLWCGTESGLYAIDDTASRTPQLVEVPIGLPGLSWGDRNVSGLAEDAEGAIWIGASDGSLYRRLPDSRVERFTLEQPVPKDQISCLFTDRKGRVWVGTTNSLYRSAPGEFPGANGFERLSGSQGGLPASRVFDIFESRDGDVWVAIYRHLAQFPADQGPARVWSKKNGLPSRGVGALGQDRDGNLWMGTGDQGVFKLAAGGSLTYSAEDGIGMDGVISISETRQGELYLSGRLESDGFRIGVRSADGFRPVAPRVPQRVKYFGWRPARMILQDHTGEWWLASSQGLCRYARLERPAQLADTAPKAVYTTRDGLPWNVVVRLYEDSKGNIWVGTETGEFAYWSRSERKFVKVPATGTPSFASAFAEDAGGHVWIGDDEGRLWRVENGSAKTIKAPAAGASVRAILPDRQGRLWVATGGQGLLRFDQPETADPGFRQYGYSDGLSSVNLYSLAEDRNGSIYIGTGGGIDRVDPDLAHFRHFTSADGIAEGQVVAAYRDRTGILWFGTNHGVTRFVPQSGLANNPPPVWITGLSIGGHPIPAPQGGESSIRQIEVQSGQQHIQFDFVGVSYSPGNILRYQYRFGENAWSVPIEARSVHYGALAPGQYRFAVRAVNSDGEVSLKPATVEFRVAPPLWKRAWFQGALLFLALAGTVWVHRARTAKLLEIERVRSTIALDLHDDIASNLSQITIFSEIAMREAGNGSAASDSLARIAETARDTVESISDIVWSIRPPKEADLQQRIRRFGSDALTLRQIDVSFHFSDEVRRLRLDPNTRRQVYLVYKEAVHNTVRHARATAVKISMSTDGDSLVLKVADNGTGLESLEEEGNGLPGMRARAASLGGRLAIHSGSGRGTEVELRVPWKRPRRYHILPG